MFTQALIVMLSAAAITQTPPEDSTMAEIGRLAAELKSDDRDIWLPAASQLGQIAARNEKLRDEVWKAARVNTLGMRFVETGWAPTCIASSPQRPPATW